MANLIEPKGFEGYQNDMEKETVLFLQKNLPENYFLIPNIIYNYTIAKGVTDSREIDAVVVAPHAVFLIEIKGYDPNLTGDENNWYLHGRGTRAVPNPVKKLESAIRKIKGSLDFLFPEFKESQGRIAGCVVLAHPQAEVKNLTGPHKYKVFRLKEPPTESQLISFLTDPQRIPNGKADAIAPLQNKLAYHFSGENPIPKTPSEFLFQGTRYKVISKEESQAGKITYLVSPRNSPNPQDYVFLTVYDLIPPDLSDEQNPEEAEKKLQAYRQRIMNEKNILESFRQAPHILYLKYDIDFEENKLYELNEVANLYPTLEEVLENPESYLLSLKQKINILRQIAKGLQYAHQKGVIHRQLSPKSVRYDSENERCLLQNFMSAYDPNREFPNYTVMVEEEKEEQAAQALNARSEEEAYIAPELTLPEEERDFRENTDLFSLGVIAYRLFLGKVPFESSTLLEYFPEKKLSQDFMPSSQNPELAFLDPIIDQTLRLNMEERIDNAETFLALLEEAEKNSLF